MPRITPLRGLRIPFPERTMVRGAPLTVFWRRDSLGGKLPDCAAILSKVINLCWMSRYNF